MNKAKLPTIKKIMAQENCSKERAISIRAILEVRADTDFFKKTGKHFLEFISASDLQKKPELAIM